MKPELNKIHAYCAGVIDSDGTIGIKKSTYAMRVRKDSTQPVYSERICVKQVEPEAVDLLYKTFGGYRTTEKPSAKNGKKLHTWQVTNIKAMNVIYKILPYLRIKKAQALNCIGLRDLKEKSKKARLPFGRGHVGAIKRPLDISIKMEDCYLYAKQLNKVGG